MKIISPGVVALEPFKVVCHELNQEMVDWWIMMGAEAQEVTDQFYLRSDPKTEKHYRIRMPGLGSKWSHKFNDGSGIVMIHLLKQYAPEASLFILKWPNNIINHSIKMPKYDYDNNE
jgi:hypothetical protein